MQTIIREKNRAHPIIKDFSYVNFQQYMFQFLKTYVDTSEPLLVTVCVCPVYLLPALCWLLPSCAVGWGMK